MQSYIVQIFIGENHQLRYRSRILDIRDVVNPDTRWADKYRVFFAVREHEFWIAVQEIGCVLRFDYVISERSESYVGFDRVFIEKEIG